MTEGPWILYVLVSDETGRTYVGISTEPTRRLEQHNGARRGGAKATRSGRPWRIGATYGPYDSRSTAQSAERQLKRRRGAARLSWSPSLAST